MNITANNNKDAAVTENYEEVDNIRSNYDQNTKIPKIIHYCWFGADSLPKSAQKCIESWRKYCEDYEIIEWNESNYDVTQNKYIHEAFKHKKWAFVTDYIRLDVIYKFGGLYFDVDVEIIKSFDDLLVNNAFIGFESTDSVNTGQGFGAVKSFQLIKEMRDSYQTFSFVEKDGSLNLTPCPTYQTEFLYKRGLILNNLQQNILGMTVYPSDYFCPKDFTTGKISITQNTYSIHNFESSWYSTSFKLVKFARIMIYKIFGNKLGKKIHMLLRALLFKEK